MYLHKITFLSSSILTNKSLALVSHSLSLAKSNKSSSEIHLQTFFPLSQNIKTRLRLGTTDVLEHKVSIQ